MLAFIAVAIYAIVQIVGIPFAIVGASLVAYRYMITSRKLGVSSRISLVANEWQEFLLPQGPKRR